MFCLRLGTPKMAAEKMRKEEGEVIVTGLNGEMNERRQPSGEREKVMTIKKQLCRL